MEQFWKRWQAEYVTSSREYQKRYKQKTKPMPNKNDLVLLFDDKEHRQKWIPGKTTELISSNDEQLEKPEILQTNKQSLFSGNEFLVSFEGR